jgi:hypothetical protein
MLSDIDTKQKVMACFRFDIESERNLNTKSQEL